MKINITQKEIGRRLSILRKNKGLSQEELAKRVGIPRSSLTQLELGKRNLSALEMHMFSIELGFSLDGFLGNEFNIDPDFNPNPKKAKDKKSRVSVPVLQVQKFKNVLLYILERCAGKPNVGETLLYKLLYFSDFNYYELYEEHLSGASYRKLPYGPVPKNLASIIKAMIEQGELKRIKTDYHDYPQPDTYHLRRLI